MSPTLEGPLMGRTRPVEGSRYKFDALDNNQVEDLARRLLLSVDLLRDRAGDVIFNDRNDFQFQEIGHSALISASAASEPSTR